MVETVADCGESAKVFISYSRKDRPAVEALRDDLRAAGFEAYLDLHDVFPGEPWQQRLGKLIEMADSVVFALSPDSVISEIVDWEVNEAERLSKRIFPVIIRDTDTDCVPGRIKRLNYIFMRDSAERSSGLPKLANALRTDIGWIREHTRLGVLAVEWERGGRAEELTLRGAPLTAAERWISDRPRGTPEPSELQRAFLRASREGEQSRLDQEKVRLAEIEIAQAGTRRFQRRSGLALAALAILLIAGFGALLYQQRATFLREAYVFESKVGEALGKGVCDLAVRYALAGLPSRDASVLSPKLPTLEAELVRASSGCNLILQVGQAGAVFFPEVPRLVTWDYHPNKSCEDFGELYSYVWDSDTGILIGRVRGAFLNSDFKTWLATRCSDKQVLVYGAPRIIDQRSNRDVDLTRLFPTELPKTTIFRGALRSPRACP